MPRGGGSRSGGRSRNVNVAHSGGSHYGGSHYGGYPVGVGLVATTGVLAGAALGSSLSASGQAPSQPFIYYDSSGRPFVLDSAGKVIYLNSSPNPAMKNI